MEEKIGVIKEKLKQCEDKELLTFLEQYQADERSGVVALCNQAVKRMAAYEKELARMEEMFTYERQFASFTAICGIDEVGRGPLAGPVVAGAVILPKGCDILYLNDSKKLSEKKREALYDVIKEKALAYSIAYGTLEEIEEFNILEAK